MMKPLIAALSVLILGYASTTQPASRPVSNDIRKRLKANAPEAVRRQKEWSDANRATEAQRMAVTVELAMGELKLMEAGQIDPHMDSQKVNGAAPDGASSPYWTFKTAQEKEVKLREWKLMVDTTKSQLEKNANDAFLFKSTLDMKSPEPGWIGIMAAVPPIKKMSDTSICARIGDDPNYIVVDQVDANEMVRRDAIFMKIWVTGYRDVPSLGQKVPTAIPFNPDDWLE